MEEAPPPPPPSTKTLGGSDSRSPDQPRDSHRRARSRSLSRSSSPSARSSAVPFSWERRPGIPKERSAAALYPVILPLPPPVRSLSDLSAPRKRRSSAARSSSSAASADPFVAALQLCARGLHDDDMDDLWDGAPGASSSAAAPRRSAASVADRLRLFGIYSSCKATCAVVDATIRVPRNGSLGFLGRRSGSDSI